MIWRFGLGQRKAAPFRSGAARVSERSQGSDHPLGPEAHTDAKPVMCARFLKKIRTCAIGLARTSFLFM